MGSLANSSSLQTTIQENPLLLSLSAFSQLSLLTLKPSPRLRLMPTTAATVMALPTTGTAMAWLTVVTTVLMLTPMELTDTTAARGLLMLRLSPPPLLSPLLMPTMAVTDMAWPITHTVMAWPTTVLTTVLTLTLMLTDTTTARGPLRPSPRPMPTTVITTDMAWPTTGTAMLTMATTATLTLPVATTDIITKLLLFCLKN